MGPHDRSPDISTQCMIDTNEIRIDSNLVQLSRDRSWTFLRSYASFYENLMIFELVDCELWSMQICIFRWLPSSHRFVRIAPKHVVFDDAVLTSWTYPLFMPSDWVFHRGASCSHRSSWVLFASMVVVPFCINQHKCHSYRSILCYSHRSLADWYECSTIMNRYKIQFWWVRTGCWLIDASKPKTMDAHQSEDGWIRRVQF